MAYYNGNEVLFSANLNIVNVDVVQKTGQNALAVMSQKAVTDTTNAINKRVINLEHRIDASLIYTDGGTAYQKDVPARALPYAAITKLGGMTYKDAAGNLQDAKTTAIKSKGSNLFNINGVTYGQNAGGDGGIPYRAVSALIPFKQPMYVKINNLPDNMQYEINYHNTDAYSYDAFVAASGWITDTDIHITQEYANTKYILILFGAIDNASTVTKEDIEAMQLQVSYNEFSTYSAYNEPEILSIPAAAQAIEGYGQGVNENYYNFIEWKPREGKKKFHKVLKKVVFDGSADEYWGIDSGGFKTSLSDISTIEGSIERACAICDKYEASEIVDLPNKTFYCASTYYGYGSIIFKDNDVALNVDNWRAYLAINPVTLLYTLNIPEVIDISDILPDDNILKVEGGGAVTFENEGQNSVPSEIIYNLS